MAYYRPNPFYFITETEWRKYSNNPMFFETFPYFNTITPEEIIRFEDSMIKNSYELIKRITVNSFHYPMKILSQDIDKSWIQETTYFWVSKEMSTFLQISIAEFYIDATANLKGKWVLDVTIMFHYRLRTGYNLIFDPKYYSINGFEAIRAKSLNESVPEGNFQLRTQYNNTTPRLLDKINNNLLQRFNLDCFRKNKCTKIQLLSLNFTCSYVSNSVLALYIDLIFKLLFKNRAFISKIKTCYYNNYVLIDGVKTPIRKDRVVSKSPVSHRKSNCIESESPEYNNETVNSTHVNSVDYREFGSQKTVQILPIITKNIGISKLTPKGRQILDDMETIRVKYQVLI